MSATTSLRRLARGRTQPRARQPLPAQPPREYEFKMTEDEAVLIHYALWLAYGNERRSRTLWQKLRCALGDRFLPVSEASRRLS